MKKNYLKPEALLVDVVVNASICNVSNGNMGEADENYKPGGGKPKPTPTDGSRGEWGNVWS